MDDNGIELMRSTVDCYDRMKANGGNVPDGFMLEFRSRKSAWMRDTLGVPTTFVDGHYYRLVPVQPPQPTYVPFTWEDRAALRGRWIRSRAELAEIAVAGLRRAGIVVDGTFVSWQVLLDTHVFADTGLPVGKLLEEPQKHATY